MPVRDIPARRVFACDGCSAEVESNSRPPHWTGLVIEANAYDYQGHAVADAGSSRILCADCTKVVHDAMNAAMQERRAALSTPQRQEYDGEAVREENERLCTLRARFSDAAARMPFVSEALAKGYQFNAYESASNDEDAGDDEREYQICIGPINDFRFLFAVEGMAKADLIEAALKVAALSSDKGEEM